MTDPKGDRSKPPHRQGDGRRDFRHALRRIRLSQPGGEAGTYMEMLRHDVATLKAGMLKN